VRRPLLTTTTLAVLAALSIAAAPAAPTALGPRGLPSGTPAGSSVGGPCTGAPGQARTFTVDVDGEPARGIVALPRRAPRGIVVFAHGYGHTSESWREHATRTADRHGVIALAMDYRGTVISPPAEPGGLPSSRGWQVAEGAEDSIAAARWFERRCGTVEQIVIHGVSMGGNASGLAAAAGATRADGTPLFDHWIAVEPAVNVVEIYQAARALALSGNAFAGDAVADIERQMGGSFEEVPATYLERTVVTRAADIAASGLRGVVLVHGLDDGLVPTNQSREMQTVLRLAGVPTELYTVVTRGPDSESGTTATGTVLGGTGVYDSPFAGHASETSTTHTVGVTGFEALDRVLEGHQVGCGDYVVDGATGIRTGAPLGC
jgi:acetyl esterase/lipase